ncbi:hypothetical protein AO1008_06105 [Aspergillus oryzae 100-8]|uniref:Siderophore biosynthesis enzyme n=1 Tax=Aspergillus oryzae (strain 3.042) TaxID=1160506 RepID=I7ZZV0_ASPO3|nr:hypothetical protein Ao3042_05844 [Aspergillus oryzae 3.042]KDE79428.1 hypothetical protein AO1008_06105 [Aspergillus oryzae 100-8]|eukprot:EIT77817.1 hypothetical protein Ao3042_05844 [Aspergillus oryzae 3.042]
MKSLTFPILLTLTSLAAARTDLDGCTKSATVNQWGEASMIWYVPDTGEICDFPDCGGGRAPPKYNQPGCAAYTGTETLTPSYLPGWGPDGKVAPSTSAVSASATHSEAEATFTGAVTSDTTKTGSTLITAAPTLSTGVSSSAAGSSSPAGSSSRVAESGSSSSSASSGSRGSSNTTSSAGVLATGNAASAMGISLR